MTTPDTTETTMRSRNADTETRLRDLEDRIALQQRRLAHLEGIERRRTIDGSLRYERDCSHCERGWIVADGDTLRCTRCSYSRHL